MRKSTGILSVWAALILIAAVLAAHAAFRTRAAGASLAEEAELVAKLGLTDLCLATEASYTRHLSLTDLFTPFQDHPTALEHFPAGSLLPPTEITRRSHGRLARTAEKHP